MSTKKIRLHPAKHADVDAYIASQPEERRRRLRAIRAAVFGAVEEVEESMRLRMPTFERDGSWVAMASQKAYLAVYFCSADLIAGVRVRHPELDCGVGCVRIRDNQHVPIYELGAAFARALGAAAAPARSANSGTKRSAAYRRSK